MIQFEDCFTPNEWSQLMIAKEVANGQTVILETHRPLFGDTTHYKLFFENIALIGEGFYVPDRYWFEARRILEQQFLLKER